MLRIAPPKNSDNILLSASSSAHCAVYLCCYFVSKAFYRQVLTYAGILQFQTVIG